MYALKKNLATGSRDWLTTAESQKVAHLWKSTDPPPPGKHHSSLDSTIERHIGDFGWAQFLQALVVSSAWIFDAQQTFITVFTDANPTWHCTSDQLDCNSVSNICNLPNSSRTWDLPAYTSIISEWNLECSHSIITGLPASSFFVGCLVGGIVLATQADSSLGHKNMLFLSCLTMSLSSLFTVFSTNIWVYSALKLVCGFCRSTIGTSALVLTAELVGKRWRGQVGVTGFLCSTIGFLSLPAIAYLNRVSSWRSLYLWTSIPGILYSMLVYFFVCERIAPPSHSSYLTRSFSEVSFEQETWNNGNVYSTIKMLVQKRWAFRRLLLVMVIAFRIGMVYYGMPLGLGNLSFNLYLSVTFNALAEIPSSLFTILLISKLNRKISVLAFTMISGIFSVMCALKGQLWTRFQIGLEIISFFSACTACNILLIFTIELFPTCVRNSATSMVRQAIVFGGVFSPMLLAAESKDGISSYVVFGLVIGCCGLFAVCLPETRGRALFDTMDEEHKEKQHAMV
ncbi:hypothetical protein ACB092_11G012600 [Castanea dentata]